MKKRIVGLALLISMLMLALCSCAYSYQKDDMSKYADYNKETFLAAMQTLKIEDGEFTESAREPKTVLAVNDKLAAAVERTEENRLVSGTFGKDQIIYFCYYAEGEDGTVYTAKMKSASASNFFAADVVDGEGLNAAVFAALDGKAYSALYVTKTATTDTVEAGKLAFVSYTRSYDEEGNAKTETFTTAPVVIPAAADDTFAGQLIGKSVATTLAEDITVGADTYSKVKVDFVVDAGECFDATYTYTASTSTTTVTGKTVDLKDKELTVHVYPQYVYVVEGYMENYADVDSEALYTAILTSVFGKSITTASLPGFTDSATYKFTDGDKEVTFKSLVENIVKLKEAYDKANTELTAATDATKAEKQTAFDSAKTALDTAVSELPGKAKQCDAEMVTLFNTAYRKSIYDSLESKYNTEIKNNLSKAVFAALKENIKVNSAPEKAVKEAAKRIYENLKNTYYTEKVSSSSDVMLKDQYPSVKAYIIEKYGVKTYDEAKEKMNAEATEAVKEVVMVYAAADMIGGITVSSDEISNYLNNLWINLYINSSGKINLSADQLTAMYGEANIRCKIVFDKVMDHFLEKGEDGKYTNLNYTIAED